MSEGRVLMIYAYNAEKMEKILKHLDGHLWGCKIAEEEFTREKSREAAAEQGSRFLTSLYDWLWQTATMDGVIMGKSDD